MSVPPRIVRMRSEPVLLFLLCMSLSECQDVDVGLVAKISTFPYEDSLNKGGLSFETKDGSDLLRRRLLIASNGNVGFNLPEGSVPEAAIHTTGDILASKGQFLEGLETVILSATTNVSAHTLIATEGIYAKFVSVDSATIKDVEVSDTLVAHRLEANTVASPEVVVSGAVRTKELYASELVNATEIITTSIKSAGIPMDEPWASHPNEICEGQHSTAANAVADASTPDLCIASCMREVSCAGVTFYADHAGREGVDAHCYMAFESCKNITDGVTPSATVYHRPQVRVLDMANELLVSKSEVARLRAEMKILKAEMLALQTEMATFTETMNTALSALHPVATTGSYNDLVNKPAITDLSGQLSFANLGGTLSYGSLSSRPSLSVVHSGTYWACDWKKDNNMECDSKVTTQILGTAINRVCFLSETKFADLEHFDELASCKVYMSGTTWLLEAATPGSNDDNHMAYCEATCTTISF
mmetsp:Transcript_39870/g.78088  ORF Transcript_39870/g.78088 Transcript_39870/m.78088 type:complete len:475 (-) Transcript_39870:117-1541(-)